MAVLTVMVGANISPEQLINNSKSIRKEELLAVLTMMVGANISLPEQLISNSNSVR